MTLDESNYYSAEANTAYFSVSQIKSFMECPARTMAELRGEWSREPSKALLIGSYVDAWFEGQGGLKRFEDAHPELFKRNGELRSEYFHARYMIARAANDKLFKEYMTGEHQVIRTGDIDGFPFKIKMDVLHPERIVDLKTTKDFNPIYKPAAGRMSFVEAWGYTLQGAVYQAIEGNHKPFYIAAITKEAEPDIAVIHVGQDYLDMELDLLKPKLPYFDAIKQGVIEPPRCEHCAYCKATRRLKEPIELEQFEEMFTDANND